MVSVPFWNRLDLKPPAFTSCSISSENPDLTSFNLGQTFDRIVSILENQTSLNLESVLLSRLLYRFKKILGKDKGFKHLQKVGKCLRHYLALDLVTTMREVRNLTYGTNGPGRASLDWCLVRLMGFATLFDRIRQTCEEASVHFQKSIRSGQLWRIVFIFTAIASRIWTISCFLVSCSCDWYTDLVSYSGFVGSGEVWLPDDFQFPQTLQHWLGYPQYLQPRKKTIAPCDAQQDETPPSVDDKVKADNPATGLGIMFNEDLGEVLSRDAFKSGKKRHRRSTIHRDRDDPITQINSCVKLLSFLKREDDLRSSGKIKSAMTKSLDPNKWKKLKLFAITKLASLRLIKNPSTLSSEFVVFQKELRERISLNN